MSNYILPGERSGSGLFGEFDRLFNPFIGDASVLKTDVKEYPDHYLLEVEVPGISKNNIDITVSDGYLTVNSTKTDKNDGTVDDWKYLRRERSVSAARSFYIGDVGEGDVKATYTDGLLYINVMKHTAADATTKKIEIH